MKPKALTLLAAIASVALIASTGALPASAHLAARSDMSAEPAGWVVGPPSFTMEEPVGGSSVQPAAAVAHASTASGYAHSPAPDPTQNIPAGSGPIMPSVTVYFVFWLPTGDTYEGTTAGDTNYENLLTRFVKDVGASQYHNLDTQYYGTNGTVANSVSFGGSWLDSSPYPDAGTTSDPLTDADIQSEVSKAVATNGWTEDLNHMVAVFTASGIQECDGSSCTFSSSNGFCAYHDDFNDGGNTAIYDFMGYDNFVHVSGKTCVAGQTGGDTDPNRFNYPNNDVSADSEINTFSHELTEAETDPEPNDTWTSSTSGEIGDACNFNFAPRNSTGADVYLNGDPYIVQQLWSNAASTCATDLPTNGFCPGALSDNVCDPTTSLGVAVDQSSPAVTSRVTYTLTLDNTSPTAAETNLTLTDTLPPGYNVDGLSAPGSTSSSSTTGGVTITYNTLPVHQSETVTITATVPDQVGIEATNCASLTGSDLVGTALPTLTSSPCAETTPVKIPTTVTYTGSTSGDYNDPATVSANLTDSLSGALPGKKVVFTLDGSEQCSAVTDGSGDATCSITPEELPGPYTLIAAFSDTTDPLYATSSTPATFTVTREDTQVAITGPLTSDYHDAVTVAARLSDPDGGAPIAGKQVDFTLGVGDTCSGTTDPAGDVTCSLTPHQTGTQPLVADFPGDPYYLPSTTSKPFVITPEETSMTYTGPTVILSGPGGATLTAQMVEDGPNDDDGDPGSAPPDPAQNVTLSLGSQSCVAATDAAGDVTCTIPSISVPLGSETVGAAFAGNAYYQPSSATTAAIVFAFPSRGAFAVGDGSAATAGSAPVTWWGATWSDENVLSGGGAPPAFKGFVDTITLPTDTPPAACGSAWTSSGGNSASPPGGLPSYMGVVVTSKVQKSGSAVVGNSVHIVVVKVAPGYATDPGHAGTGTIVAVYC